MTGKPLISVIMPCFNGASFLQEAVQCVIGQTYQPVELVVVDDGSEDNSWELLQNLSNNHPGLKLLRQANSGPYPARNLGLQHARGEYVAFLDADDFWSPDCLMRLFEGLKSADADLAYCGWQNIVEEGVDRPPYVPPAYEEEDLTAHFLRACPWPIHAALTKRSVVEEVDGFSTRRFSSMDYDFWLRILAATRNITRVPEVLAFYRWHDKGQISSVKWKQAVDAWHVRRDFIRAHPDLVHHLARGHLKELRDGSIHRLAYDAFWKRELVSAQHLFRFLIRTGYWRIRDLKYILPSLLPPSLFRRMVRVLE